MHPFPPWDVNEEKLKELQKAVGVLNGTTALRYAIIRAYNEVDVEDLINSSEEIKKAQIKTAKAREEALKKSEAARAEKAKARKLKQLEKLKKELNEA